VGLVLSPNEAKFMACSWMEMSQTELWGHTLDTNQEYHLSTQKLLTDKKKKKSILKLPTKE
jgi:hypothetical protein